MTRCASGIWQRMGLLCAATACALLLGEVFARAFSPEWLRVRMRQLNTGGNRNFYDSDQEWPFLMEPDGRTYQFIPGSSLRQVIPEYDFTASIDRWGGRVTTCGCAPDEPLVPFLGDSMLFGVGVADEEAYPSLLCRRVPGYCFLNLGIPGSGPDHYFKVLKRRHQALGAPSVYVVNFFMGNDYTDGPFKDPSATGPVVSVSGRLRATALALLQKINHVCVYNAFFKRSYLVQRLRQQFFSLYVRFSGRGGYYSFFQIAHTRLFKDVQQDSLRRIRGILDQFAQARADMGIEILFVLLPDKFQLYDHERKVKAEFYGLAFEELDPAKLNRIISEELAARQFTFIDLTECVRAQKAQPLYYRADFHFTAYGNRVCAECLGPGLEAALRKWSSRNAAGE